MTAAPHPVRGGRMLALVLACASAAPLFSADTLVYWNFDTGAPGAALSAQPATDAASGLVLHGFNEQTSPRYSTDTATGRGRSLHASVQDGYTVAPELNNWAPRSWTIEVSVKLDVLDGWNTIIGRDGSSFPGAQKSDFYFQNNGTNNRFRLDFATADGTRYVIESDFAPAPGVWHHVALVSDGDTASMYIDRRDGRGYRLATSTALSRKPGANNALPASGFNWTFGRGWFAGKYVDNIEGNLDDIRFTSRALAPAEFLHAPADAASSVVATGSSIDVVRDGADVSLAWKRPVGAVRHVEVFRHDRADPAGRERVALLNSSAEIYLERVPSAQTAYWYWLLVTRPDGATETVGPVLAKTTLGVWTP